MYNKIQLSVNNFSSSSQHLGKHIGHHIEGLDGLRAIAIIGVTFFHIIPAVLPGGYMGVSLFFLLTGYLLAFTTYSSFEAGHFNVIGYYTKRIRRIYPALIIMLLTSIGVFYFLVPKSIAAVRPEVMSILLGYNNWWQIAQNADYFSRMANTSPFTHLWFLGIELQYYLIWPILFFIFIGVRKKAGQFGGILLIAFVGVISALLMPLWYQLDIDVTRLYYGTDTRIYALLFGACMGLVKADTNSTVSSNVASNGSIFTSRTGIFSQISFIALLSITIAAYFLMDGQSSLVYQGGMLGMTLVFCLMLALASNSYSNVGHYVDNPVLKWIGKRSYGIFLWQYPVIYLFSHEGWDKLPLYIVIELALIVLLTIWSDTLANSLLDRHWPEFKLRFWVVQCSCFLIISLSSAILMAYGCAGIVVSAESKSALQAELQANLEIQAVDQDEKNEEAAKAAAAAKETQKQQLNLSGIVCIGDSVMLGSSGELRKTLPDCLIDADVCRYVGGGIEVAQSFEAQGLLGDIVVIGLGTNGPIAGAERYEVQTKALVECLGSKRHIFWVNVYCPETGWQDTNNAYINQLAATHANIKVIDWCGLISQHPDWLVSDGIHPNDTGTVQYAKLVHDRIVEVLTAEL